MSDLSRYENLIQEKRRNTDFHDFIKEIASWYPFAFYKYDEGFVGKFPKEKIRLKNPVPSKVFHELRDGLLSFGVDYTGNFFSDLSRMFFSMPIEAMKQFDGSINSEYADIALGKNIYLTSVGFNSENVAYSFNVKQNCRNVYNSVLVWENCENIYFGRYITESFQVFYSQYIHSSRDIWFSSDLIGCQECIACSGLRNMQYCINNTPYSREEYAQKKQKYLSEKERFSPLYQTILDRATNSKITNYQCESIQNGYMNYRVQNGRNIMLVGSDEAPVNMFDVFSAGILPNKDFYGVMGAGLGSEHLYCSVEITTSSRIFYSYLLESCSFCLGCVGLKNRSYCILNKQYSKEDWNTLVERIFANMERDGTLGDFFPPSMNPFYFNDTLASLIDPDFTREEIERDGYLWRNHLVQVDIPDNASIIESQELSVFQGWKDGKWRIDEKILEKVIRDHSVNYYRIIPMEYDFLMKYALPLPEFHWLDRIKMGFRL